MKGPFITWDFQDKAIVGGSIRVGDQVRYQDGILKCIDDQQDVRWPKSRDIGASWIVLMTILHCCLFRSSFKALVMSKDADAVDKIDDPDSLFWKLRFMLEHLPEWMTGEIRHKKAGISFVGSGNSITGEANTESSGVGGRATVMLIDEFGQFDKNGEKTYDFTTDTSNCRIFVFTHKNTSGMAYKLCYDSKFIGMREIIVHWSQHPEKGAGLYRYNEETCQVEILDPTYKYPPGFEFVLKNEPTGGPFPGIRSPWYDSQCARRTERDIQMNLDIDPRGASDLFFDTWRVRSLQSRLCRPPVWRGDLLHDKEGRPIKFEENDKGFLKLWVHPRNDNELPRIKAGAGVDVAAGSGNSPSCLSVFNAQTGEKVLEYANANIFAPNFAVMVAAILRTIKDGKGLNPLVCWELQGSQVFEQVIVDQCRYSPVRYRRDEEVRFKPIDGKMRAGWVPTPKNVLTLMEEYRDGLYEMKITNFSEEAMKELLNFYYTTSGVEYKAVGKKKESDSGARIHHGDIVRSDALAYKMIKEMGFDSPEVKKYVEDVIDLRTFDGRAKFRELLEQDEWA